MIQTCSLSIITSRGANVVDPSISELDVNEEDFLHKHVADVRGLADKPDGKARGRFQPYSAFKDIFRQLLSADSEEFLEFSRQFTHALAVAMGGTGNASDCVVALLTHGSDSTPEMVTLLKLDAKIEAAQIRRNEGKVRLKVFQDLLPSPGDIQKALSWPDDRSGSDLIVHDRGATTSKYFQNAYKVEAAPTAVETENALRDSIADLPAATRSKALAIAETGGFTAEIVQKIQAVAPALDTSHPALDPTKRADGVVRPGQVGTGKKTFTADGIELKVPAHSLNLVETRAAVDGDGYETIVHTSTPLTPIQQ